MTCHGAHCCQAAVAQACSRRQSYDSHTGFFLCVLGLQPGQAKCMQQNVHWACVAAQWHGKIKGITHFQHSALITHTHTLVWNTSRGCLHLGVILVAVHQVHAHSIRKQGSWQLQTWYKRLGIYCSTHPAAVRQQVAPPMTCQAQALCCWSVGHRAVHCQ